jgi:hypothetical protein
MSSDLERRLTRALGEVAPSDAAGEQAREAALAAMPGGIRRRHRLALIVAAALAGLVLAGGAVAASDTVREAVGISPKKSGPPSLAPAVRGPLPAGASGFATVAGRHVWLARSGARDTIRGSFSAFELSPNAIYAAAGGRGALLALDPTDLSAVRRFPVRGTVTAISWAPIGIHIAYVVRAHGRSSLHVIDGNLTNDRVIDQDVSPVVPSWRWDSLAVAYATRSGAVRTYDLWQGRIVSVKTPHCASASVPDQLAYAPHADQLAVGWANRSNVWIADTGEPHRSFCAVGVPALGPPTGAGFAWISHHDLVETTYQFLQRVHVGNTGATAVSQAVERSGIAGIAASPDGRSLALAMRGRRVILVDTPPAHGPVHGDIRDRGQLPVRQVLLTLAAAPAQGVRLIWR